MRTGREVHLVSRPAGGRPAPGDIALVEVPVPDPRAGEVLVRNLYMSIDPGTLLRMSDLTGTGIPDFPLGTALWSDAVGEVVASRHPDLQPGDLAWHRFGWRDYVVAGAEAFRRVDASTYPSVSHHLGFGVVGYIGVELARVGPGDTVFVSSAAGAVGSVAGQVARLRGASRVIGSVGSAEKMRYATQTLGFDAAFDYHDGVRCHLEELDVYFDTVGGEHLDAAIDAMRPRGRILLCGATSRHHLGVAPGPRDMLPVMGKRLSMTAFYTFDHPDIIARFEEEFPVWVRTGQVVLAETVVDGLENGVAAVLGQAEGAYLGKVVLRL